MATQTKAMAASTSEQAMSTLSAQWYNALIQGLHLSASQFQLVQGYEPVGTSTEWLWNMFDAVPPKSVSTHYDPAQINSYSKDYGGVISALIAQGALQFEKAIGGTYYTQWNNYKKTLSPIPSTPMEWINAFTNWANVNLPQSQVTPSISAFRSMLQDPIFNASSMWDEMQNAGKNPNVCAYTTTYGQLQMQLSNGAPASVILNSSTDSSDITNTWAKFEMGGIFDIFGGDASSSYSSLSETVTSAGLNINCKFDKVVTLAAGPLTSPSSDFELQNYTPWYNSSALNTGYQDQSNNVWKSSSAITWDSSFGPKGNMQRFCSALVIVDGITLSMTSKAGLSTADQASFKAQASAGVFPFFEASGSGGWSTSTTFDSSGNFTVSSTCKQGNPQVLGVLVTELKNVFTQKYLGADREGGLYADSVRS